MVGLLQFKIRFWIGEYHKWHSVSWWNLINPSHVKTIKMIFTFATVVLVKYAVILHNTLRNNGSHSPPLVACCFVISKPWCYYSAKKKPAECQDAHTCSRGPIVFKVYYSCSRDIFVAGCGVRNMFITAGDKKSRNYIITVLSFIELNGMYL